MYLTIKTHLKYRFNSETDIRLVLSIRQDHFVYREREIRAENDELVWKETDGREKTLQKIGNR